MARFAMHFNVLLIAVIATVAWTLLDRRRTNYTRLYAWVRAWVRLQLATIMFGYGVAKIIPTQFPTPNLDRYVQPLGEFSPMGLRWTFMGHSPAYTIFAGAIEVLGATLVLFRRTATLGALLFIGALSQVLMLNFAYDVPVKLFSIHLIVMACFIAALDIRRLAAVLVLNRPIAQRHTPPLLHDRGQRYALTSAVALFIGYILWTDVSGGLTRLHEERSPQPGLYGIYDVDALEKNGVASPPLLSDSTRWRRVVFARDARVIVRTMSDSVSRYVAETDTSAHSVILWSRVVPGDTLAFAYNVAAPDLLILKGQVHGDTIVARLRRVDETKFLLVNRGFRWVQERPFNR